MFWVDNFSEKGISYGCTSEQCFRIFILAEFKCFLNLNHLSFICFSNTVASVLRLLRMSPGSLKTTLALNGWKKTSSYCQIFVFEVLGFGNADHIHTVYGLWNVPLKHGCFLWEFLMSLQTIKLGCRSWILPPCAVSSTFTYSFLLYT